MNKYAELMRRAAEMLELYCRSTVRQHGKTTAANTAKELRAAAAEMEQVRLDRIAQNFNNLGYVRSLEAEDALSSLIDFVDFPDEENFPEERLYLDWAHSVLGKLIDQAAEMEQAEPVAWITTAGSIIWNDGSKYNEHWEPLYRHPAPVARQEEEGDAAEKCADAIIEAKVASVRASIEAAMREEQ